MLESLTVQYMLVAIIVLTATVLLVIRASKYFLPAAGKPGCASGCGGCVNKEAASSQLIQLGNRSHR